MRAQKHRKKRKIIRCMYICFEYNDYMECRALFRKQFKVVREHAQTYSSGLRFVFVCIKYRTDEDMCALTLAYSDQKMSTFVILTSYNLQHKHRISIYK
jgi:hypothetical protein